MTTFNSETILTNRADVLAGLVLGATGRREAALQALAKDFQARDKSLLVVDPLSDHPDDSKSSSHPAGLD
jgi:hypothetical protein